MIDRAKIEKFVEKMDGNKYLATLFLAKRVAQLQERKEKLIAGSQRFTVEQAIDEFLEDKFSFEYRKPKPVKPIIDEDILAESEELDDIDEELIEESMEELKE